MTSISIIMPAYKTERYIAEAIESVLTQSFQDWELLIVDDGSPDDLLSIASSYTQKDSRIKVFSQPNQGVAVARNKGLELAQGDYIAFLDSDDYWNPLFLEKMIEKMESDPSYGLVYSGYYKERKGKPAKKFGDLFIEKELLKARLENRQGWHLCAFLIRKSFIA